jgi:acyl-phosphate glycerol 3-phosphate acyltransferase
MLLKNWITYVFIVVASYLWGSICWGLVLSFGIKHEDIRLKDNPGLSGSVRQYGWAYGLTVGFLDTMKGYLLSLALHSWTVPSWVIIASFAAVIVGHNWPLFFQFRGGGGVATTLGILLQSYPVAIFLALPFAAVAGVIWKLNPVVKAKLHFSPFIAGVGAVPAAIWVFIHKPWYPDYVIVVALAASVLIKGNQFHLQAQRLRNYAGGMRDRVMDHYHNNNLPPAP